jgi:hypothetical protein
VLVPHAFPDLRVETDADLALVTARNNKTHVQVACQPELTGGAMFLCRSRTCWSRRGTRSTRAVTMRRWWRSSGWPFSRPSCARPPCPVIATRHCASTAEASDTLENCSEVLLASLHVSSFACGSDIIRYNPHTRTRHRAHAQAHTLTEDDQAVENFIPECVRLCVFGYTRKGENEMSGTSLRSPFARACG